VNGVQVPPDLVIAIFLDIEDSNPEPNFFQGFADTFAGSGYVGGIYGGQDYFGSNLCVALNGIPSIGYLGDANVINLVIYGNNPETTGCTAKATAPAYSPNGYSCSANLPVSIWQYAEGCLSSTVDEDLAMSLSFMW
jgi:hypothetical protein